MSHIDPKQPTVMPAYPLGSPPGAETADPQEDPQAAHPLPASTASAPADTAPAQRPRPEPPSAQGEESDEEWTVQADADATSKVSRR
jgi:hypothetical protein